MGPLQGLPHLLLAGVVGIDGEGHQLLQGHAVLGVDLEQLLRHGRQPQALAHDIDRHEEGCGDLLLGLALLAQRQEGAELVERMQRLGHASTVLHGVFRRICVGFSGSILQGCPLCGGGDRHRAERDVALGDEPSVVPPVALGFGLG